MLSHTIKIFFGFFIYPSFISGISCLIVTICLLGAGLLVYFTIKSNNQRTTEDTTSPNQGIFSAAVAALGMQMYVSQSITPIFLSDILVSKSYRDETYIIKLYKLHKLGQSLKDIISSHPRTHLLQYLFQLCRQL